jgi:hypothetical protein
MLILLKIIILIALIKLLQSIGKPWLIALIYTVLSFILVLVSGQQLNSDKIPLYLLIAYAMSFVYFWLLQRTEETFWYWIILLGGIFLFMV